LDGSLLDTGVRVPLREGIEKTAWPLAPGDNILPKVAKTSADSTDAAEWGRGAYGLEGEVRGKTSGGSGSKGLGVGIRSEDLND
jgi:hypothetical protein